MSDYSSIILVFELVRGYKQYLDVYDYKHTQFVLVKWLTPILFHLYQICVGAVQRPLLADMWPCNPGPALMSAHSLCGAQPALQFHHEHVVTPIDENWAETEQGMRGERRQAPMGSKLKNPLLQCWTFESGTTCRNPAVPVSILKT